MRKRWYFPNKENYFSNRRWTNQKPLEEIRTWEHPPWYGIDQFKERVTLIFLENQKGLFHHLKTRFRMPVKLWMNFGPCQETSCTAITLNQESNFTCREKNHSLFHWNTLTFPELHIRIWMLSKSDASVVVVKSDGSRDLSGSCARSRIAILENEPQRNNRTQSFSSRLHLQCNFSEQGSNIIRDSLDLHQGYRLGVVGIRSRSIRRRSSNTLRVFHRASGNRCEALRCKMRTGRLRAIQQKLGSHPASGNRCETFHHLLKKCPSSKSIFE